MKTSGLVEIKLHTWHAYTYTHTNRHTYIHARTHTRAHTHTHTHIHTYIHKLSFIHRCTMFAKFKDISCQLPASLLVISAATTDLGLEDESGMIKPQLGTHNRSIDQKMVAVAWDALYDTTPQQLGYL
jgi:hypothetical protein